MGAITKAGLLALAAVLLLPSAPAQTQTQELPPLVLLVQHEEDPDAQPVQTLTLLRDGQTEQLSWQTYLTQVVLSELPASFEPEAMKAQAVAARTFARRQSAGGKHETAAVCADSSCCQACLTVETLRERYGTAFPEAWEKASAAVQETENEVLTWNGELIEAVYFSCSGGSTEAAEAVWGSAVPYLQAIESPGEQDAQKYASTVTVSAQDFANTLQTLDERLHLSGSAQTWVQGLKRTAGGGVDTLYVGGCAFSGTQLRRAFGLNSTKFTLTCTEDSFRFDVLGYGHRVGMSQYGANAIARLGFDYRAILRFYYRGAQLTTLGA